MIDSFDSGSSFAWQIRQLFQFFAILTNCFFFYIFENYSFSIHWRVFLKGNRNSTFISLFTCFPLFSLTTCSQNFMICTDTKNKKGFCIDLRDRTFLNLTSNYDHAFYIQFFLFFLDFFGYSEFVARFLEHFDVHFIAQVY